MAGTITGGKKAAQSNKERHGEDFYSRIGKKGGHKSRTGGFAALDKRDKNGMTGPERARLAGQLGGKRSKRGKENR